MAMCLFGFNYHVPFRLSKINFDYLAASKAGREVKRNTLSLLLFRVKPLVMFTDRRVCIFSFKT